MNKKLRNAKWALLFCYQRLYFCHELCLCQNQKVKNLTKSWKPDTKVENLKKKKFKTWQKNFKLKYEAPQLLGQEKVFRLYLKKLIYDTLFCKALFSFSFLVIFNFVVELSLAYFCTTFYSELSLAYLCLYIRIYIYTYIRIYIDQHLVIKEPSSSSIHHQSTDFSTQNGLHLHQSIAGLQISPLKFPDLGHLHKLVKQLRVRWNWSCDHELSNSGSVAIQFSIDLHSQNWNERKSEYSPPPPASPAPVNLLMSYLRSQKSEGLFTEDEGNWNTDLTNGSLVLPGSLPIRIQYFGEIHFTDKLQTNYRHTGEI